MRGRSRHGRPSSPPAESAALGARTQLRERRSGPKMPPPRRPRRQREPRNPLDLEPPQWLLETEEWRRGGEVVPSCVGGREGESRQEYWQRGKGGAAHGVGGSTSGGQVMRQLPPASIDALTRTARLIWGCVCTSADQTPMAGQLKVKRTWTGVFSRKAKRLARRGGGVDRWG